MLSQPEVDRLANGRIYSAPQALANGLVDRVGTLEDAVGLLEDRLGVSESRVVAYHRPSERRRNIYARAMGGAPFGSSATTPGQFGPSASGGLAADALSGLLQRPGFHYLWWPGLRSLGSGG